jgi:L-histidine N-alpha-methyltransferase
VPTLTETLSPVAQAVREGLLATPKTLPPWLFYDAAGSKLFERITQLPEYYLTRTERALFVAHADEIISALPKPLTLAELGAGTASKSGVLLAAATRAQGQVLYQPIDVSPSALEEARTHLQSTLSGVTVRPQVANYISEPIRFERPAGASILALYIGSSIGNFSPHEARNILKNLRAQLRPGDALLLGTDLAPNRNKTIQTLLAAYDDAEHVTAAFNLNVLNRLNRELQASFNVPCFRHRARWNAVESRIEMHLESLMPQTVHIPADAGQPALTVSFRKGETIHTENSYKFSPESLANLLIPGGFTPTRTFHDPQHLFAVTLAAAS